MSTLLRFAPVIAAAGLLLVACDDKKPQAPAPAPAAEVKITSENMSSELDKLEKEIDAQ